LLRVLTDSQIPPVGSDVTRSVDVRVVCATNKDLAKLVAQGKFREDLYHRLNVVAIRVPPLRERVEDIPLLAEHLLQRARERNPHGTVREWTPAALAALARCTFAGNIRQLENTIERLVIVCTGTQIDVADLQEHASTLLAGPSPLADMHERLPTLRQLEADYISWVIGYCGGNKSRAAEILGIDPSTIHRRERSLGNG
jgi:two-component system response regulator HydG